MAYQNNNQEHQRRYRSLLDYIAIMYGMIVALLAIPGGLLRVLNRRYWRNKDIYFQLLTYSQFEATKQHWQVENELLEHNVHIMSGEYHTGPDVVVVQIGDKKLLDHPAQTVLMIKEVFKRHGYRVMCLGNDHDDGIWPRG
jgi:hypothetical protein